MPYDGCVSLSDLPHLVRSSRGPSMLLQVAWSHSSSRLSSAPSCVCHASFTRPSVSGHLGCCLAVVDAAAVALGCLPPPDCVSLWMFAQQWVCWVMWWFYFSFSEDTSACSALSAHFLRRWLWVAFLMAATMTRGRWCLTVVFVCISLVICDVEHLFLWCVVICSNRTFEKTERHHAHWCQAVINS